MTGDVSGISAYERPTQRRLIALLREQLGYHYLGDWRSRDNRNIEPTLLTEALRQRGYSQTLIDKALHHCRSVTTFKSGERLIDKNRACYQLLRYGARIKTGVDVNTETVQLIDWQVPERNHFAVAEEVRLRADGHGRRPDLVLYINGIAVAIIELKSPVKPVSDAIEQHIINQKESFNAIFFATAQLLIAASDSEGLHYGTVGTPAKRFCRWKEAGSNDNEYPLDQHMRRLCAPERLVELLRDFIIFEGDVKKVPQPHQYFAVKAAQRQLQAGRGGIIWHTQGSGKSLVMLLLAKWLVEHNPHARVVIVTDRDELDAQIGKIFADAQQPSHRARSGRDLYNVLSAATPRIICTLLHKFDHLPQRPAVHGQLFVFVDECHRSHSARFHLQMKQAMPNAVYIGFTGTPLLKCDAQTSQAVFGDYIHTYKFDEAVADKVVLDLVYEARDVDQSLTDQQAIDDWFDEKTRGLNEQQQALLKRKWSRQQVVLSSQSRINAIVTDICMDFDRKARLNNGTGNAMLVCQSIFEACLYYQALQRTSLRGQCGLVTSYGRETPDDDEPLGDSSPAGKHKIKQVHQQLLKDIVPQRGKSRAAIYEALVKTQFREQPDKMRLLIVVDKLLTGFDAPPCTYIYIDKAMQDHGLFQAICRTNRLDGNSKEYGYIIDYRQLLGATQQAMAVYTSALAHDDVDSNILLKDRLQQGRERLETALDTLAELCAPVPEPREHLQYIHYFCGHSDQPHSLDATADRRIRLYKAVATLTRAYASIAGELPQAGFSDDAIDAIDTRLKAYVALRASIKLTAGETLDTRAYEVDMRHLIDTYIKAESARTISQFADIGLVELIVQSGINKAIAAPSRHFNDDTDAIGEYIENNIAVTINTKKADNPAFFDTMSQLLQTVIYERRNGRIAFADYLRRMQTIAQHVSRGYDSNATLAALREDGALRLVYDNLGALASGNSRTDVATAQRIVDTVTAYEMDEWRDNTSKYRRIAQALAAVLANDDEAARILSIIKAQKQYFGRENTTDD